MRQIRTHRVKVTKFFIFTWIFFRKRLTQPPFSSAVASAHFVTPYPLAIMLSLFVTFPVHLLLRCGRFDSIRIALLIFLPMILVARWSGSSCKCAYRCVVAGFMCPNNPPMIGSPNPDDAPVLAKVCRRSWSRTSFISAFSRIRSQMSCRPTKCEPRFHP